MQGPGKVGQPQCPCACHDVLLKTCWVFLTIPVELALGKHALNKEATGGSCLVKGKGSWSLLGTEKE